MKRVTGAFYSIPKKMYEIVHHSSPISYICQVKSIQKN